MQKYIGYIRVSTHKQGEKGSSLVEQKTAIETYAKKHQLEISNWYEEQETAAKQGRKQFQHMLNQINSGRAKGVILHKVDRGARNLKDWAELATLMDSGVDIHFAHESLDLTTRGGRLSADIQAVVAADFIRNLRDEVKKGMYGRLKQGFYPWAAPIGYQNNGGGQLKTIDPVQGLLVQEIFRLYSTGEHTLLSLVALMEEKKLVNASGKPVGKNSMSHILSNHFYYGFIEVNGQTFVGKHEPLISSTLFHRVQAIKNDRRNTSGPKKGIRKSYALQRLLDCKNCSYRLYPEMQKGNVYFRCQSKICAGTSLRESHILNLISSQLKKLNLGTGFEKSITDFYVKHCQSRVVLNKKAVDALRLQLGQANQRFEKLTDLLLEGLITKEEYEARKEKVYIERIQIQELLDEKMGSLEPEKKRLKKFLELSNSLKNIASLHNMSLKRQVLKTAISNIDVLQKTVEIKWAKPYQTLFDLWSFPVGVQQHDSPRSDEVLEEVIAEIVEWRLLDSYEEL
jgi:site-specific DNA recombinase